MKDFIKSDKFILSILILIAGLGIFLFWGKQGHLIIDWGRELLISEQVSQGLVLYKDIFNIYGPFAYQLNAILFKIFGIHTNTLYTFGAVISILITAGMYVLSREFLNKKLSFAITLSLILTGIYKEYIFNLTVPYSYDMTYGLCAFIYALIAITKYNKTDSVKFAYAASFLAGICITCKYEFAFFPFILLLNFLWIKPLGLKKTLLAFLNFITIPFISFGCLVVQGFRWNDFINTIEIFKNIAKSPSLKYFYSHIGIYFSWNKFVHEIIPQFMLLATILAILYLIINKIQKLSDKKQKMVLHVLITTLLILGFTLYKDKNIINFLPLLVCIIGIVKIKELIKNPSKMIIWIATLLYSSKSFFTMPIHAYGIFFFPLILLNFAILTIDKNKTYTKAFTILLIAFSFSQLNTSFNYIKYMNYKLNSPKGYIGVASQNGATRILIDIIKKITKQNDTIVILPEGHLINFLSDRKSDPFYNNLIPMYVETFGEDKIINHYKNTPPDYFVINDRDTTEYGKKRFCLDYANKLCSWIFDNYHVVYRIEGEPLYFIFRKN